MDDFLGVGDAGRELDVNPKLITDAFYKRELREDICPVVSGRRLIPRDYLPLIATALRRKGVAVRDPEPITEGTR